MTCPSTNPYSASGGIFVTLHTGSDPGTVYGASFSRGYNLGLTNYLGSAGGLGTVPGNSWDKYRGIFGNRTKYKFADMQDGSSTTLLFGEKLGGCTWSRTSVSSTFTRTLDSSDAWMSPGSCPTAWGLYIEPDPNSLTWDHQGWFMFSADHPNIVQFAFGDGSVHQLNVSMDFSSYVFVSGMRDGRMVDSSQLNL
jgi:hypothetical protein